MLRIPKMYVKNHNILYDNMNWVALFSKILINLLTSMLTYINVSICTGLL